MNTLRLAVTGFAALAAAQTNPTLEEAAAYPEWAFVMADWVAEYAWSPCEVTTEDGHILTMFKISKRFSECESTESVLYQHGYGFDATETVGL